MTRRVVVNGDDFGLTPGINRAIVEAHVAGIVTSTSAMVRQPEASDAASLALAHPNLGVGLHVDLGEWAYIDGSWTALYHVVDTDDHDAVASEVDLQVARFHDLFGRPPSHLDSHQHVHNDFPAPEVLIDRGSRLEIPVRGAGASAMSATSTDSCPPGSRITRRSRLSHSSSCSRNCLPA